MSQSKANKAEAAQERSEEAKSFGRRMKSSTHVPPMRTSAIIPEPSRHGAPGRNRDSSHVNSRLTSSQIYLISTG